LLRRGLRSGLRSWVPYLLLALAAVLGVANALVLAQMGARLPDLYGLGLCFSMLVASELVRAVRLALLARLPPTARGLVRAFTARLASQAVAMVTPSSMGGEVVKGILVRGLGFEAVGVGLVDSLLDLWGNTLLALILLPFSSKPLAYLLAGCGVAVSLLWLLGLSMYPSIVRRVFRYQVPRRLPLSRGVLAAGLALSMLSFVLTGLGLLTYASAPLSVMAVAYGMLAGLVPTPGGVLAIDTVIALLASPTAAATWRAAYYLLGVLGAIVIAASLPLLRRG
jgi:hypothetical protein